MNQSTILGWLSLVFVTLMAVGCASTRTPAPTSGGSAQYDRNKPQTFLANASVEQVKGVAMGSAVSKGWTVVKSGKDTLILQRDLDPATVQRFAPRIGYGSRPRIEVRSGFFPRDGGVDVVLDAKVISSSGSKNEKRDDFTENFRPELMRSLSALRQAWNDSGWRVAAATPPVATSQPMPDTDLDLNSPAPAAGVVADDLARAPEQEPATSALNTQPPSSSRIRSAWGTDSSSDPGGPVPVEDRSQVPYATQPLETASPVIIPPPPASSVPDTGAEPTMADNAATNALEINRPVNTGVWAYYAESYARDQGCGLTASGAKLLEKRELAEIHRVDCMDGRSYLIRCSAGVCRDLR